MIPYTREQIDEISKKILEQLRLNGVKTGSVVFCGGKNMKFGWVDLDKGVIIMGYEDILKEYFDTTPPNYKEFDIEWV